MNKRLLALPLLAATLSSAALTGCSSDAANSAKSAVASAGASVASAAASAGASAASQAAESAKSAVASAASSGASALQSKGADVAASASAAVSSAAAGATGSSNGSYSLAQVKEHGTASDCWVAINGNVYNVTAWEQQHPGGAQNIINLCGTDGTAAFTAQHGNQSEPNSELAEFKIGTLSQ